MVSTGRIAVLHGDNCLPSDGRPMTMLAKKGRGKLRAGTGQVIGQAAHHGDHGSGSSSSPLLTESPRKFQPYSIVPHPFISVRHVIVQALGKAGHGRWY
jgi:hypothetical protein